MARTRTHAHVFLSPFPKQNRLYLARGGGRFYNARHHASKQPPRSGKLQTQGGGLSTVLPPDAAVVAASSTCCQRLPVNDALTQEPGMLGLDSPSRLSFHAMSRPTASIRCLSDKAVSTLAELSLLVVCFRCFPSQPSIYCAASAFLVARSAHLFAPAAAPFAPLLPTPPCRLCAGHPLSSVLPPSAVMCESVFPDTVHRSHLHKSRECSVYSSPVPLLSAPAKASPSHARRLQRSNQPSIPSGRISTQRQQGTHHPASPSRAHDCGQSNNDRTRAPHTTKGIGSSSIRDDDQNKAPYEKEKATARHSTPRCLATAIPACVSQHNHAAVVLCARCAASWRVTLW